MHLTINVLSWLIAGIFFFLHGTNYNVLYSGCLRLDEIWYAKGCKKWCCCPPASPITCSVAVSPHPVVFRSHLVPMKEVSLTCNSSCLDAGSWLGSCPYPPAAEMFCSLLQPHALLVQLLGIPQMTSKSQNWMWGMVLRGESYFFQFPGSFLFFTISLSHLFCCLPFFSLPVFSASLHWAKPSLVRRRGTTLNPWLCLLWRQRWWERW